MRSSTGSLIGVLCMTNIVLGWSGGYHSVTAYLTFWLLAALPLLTSQNIVVHLWPSVDAADRAVRIAVTALAIIVGCGLLLGGLRLLNVEGFLCVEAVLFAASYAIPDNPPLPFAPGRTDGDRSLILALGVGVATALLAFAMAF